MTQSRTHMKDILKLTLEEAESMGVELRGTCPNCLQDVVKTGHQANGTLGQSLLEIEDWRRTRLPGGVDWT